MDFPTREEEYRIIRGKLAGPKDELIKEVVDILQKSHSKDEDLSVRDGLNIARYAHRLLLYFPHMDSPRALDQSLLQITGETRAALHGPKLV
jgi:hypothetical protein